MATYDYKGTKITGTSTAAKKFKKSGVKSAKKGDTYLNTSTGHVYKCTEKGKTDDAKWKYVRTDIVKVPSKTVSGLGKPTRTPSHKMNASWKVPTDMVDDKKGNRATGLSIEWTLDTSDKDKHKVITTSNEKLTTSSINLDSIKIGNTTFKRDNFYPNKSRKLYGVSVSVRGTNSKGKGKKVTEKRRFEKPRTPSIDTPSFNTENGTVTFPISANAGEDYKERYDTKHYIEVYNSNLDKTTKPSGANGTHKSTNFSISTDIISYQAMSYLDYFKVTAFAQDRGYAGNSQPTDKTFYVSYPAQTNIDDVDVSGNTAMDKCTVYITTNNKDPHPVDQVRLEYAANVEYLNYNNIPGEAWTASDIVDDGDCTALTVPVALLLPERGNHTWIRVKSYHANEAVLFRYSTPHMVTELETPAQTAADDDITILSATAGLDGESIVVLLGWNQDGEDDSTGTEISWAQTEDAWRSTDDPDSYSFTWSDGPLEYDNVTYYDSATITIKGLEEGQLYYVKARRYMDGDTTTYSKYSNPATCITSEIPESVVASCDRYIPSGSSLPVFWTFAGNGLQTSWQIMSRIPSELDPSVLVDGVVLGEGKGSIGSARIEASDLVKAAVDGFVTFNVQVSTGSGYIVSEDHTVTIMDPPTLSVSAASSLTAQPFEFTATASTISNLRVIVTSQGISGQYPEGQRRQTKGDTIYSGIITPEWAESSGVFNATVGLPEELDFWDKGTYTLSVAAIDTLTGLQSEPQEAAFTIAWEHQAPSILPTVTYTATTDTEVVADKAYYEYDSVTETYEDVLPEGTENPSEEGWFEQNVTNYVTLTPIDTIDDNEMHHQAVQIALTPPPNSREDDVYDIYRLTGDGARLIGQGFPLTYTAQDEYAPFGDDMTHYYRIAVRTTDGDVEFADLEYTLDSDSLRFDWAGGSLELPYNLSISDKYKKDVDTRSHMDGGIDGYWNQNIDRSGSFSSDVIRLTQQDEIDSARDLARYAGAVFVRTPDGSAYEADVQVTDLSTEGVLTAIAIDATEIGLTEEFILPTPNVLEPEEEESE